LSFHGSLFGFLSLFHAADPLSMTNARIASLEAELEASRKAWDVATATKAVAEKSAKSGVAKVKKVAKALADADRARAQREQAITNRLNQISALAGGEYRAFLFLAYLLILLLAGVCSFISCLCILSFHRKYWSIFGAFAAGQQRSSDGCGEFAGGELDICPGNSRADSPHANADFCRVMAEEEGGCANC
jgi:hypothetical protein